MEKYLNYKLCYVESSEYVGEPMTLYFTELDDVTKQWGDDWDDAPYEHNAGEPYESDYSAKEQGVKNGVGIFPKIDIFKVIISGHYRMETPRTHRLNSPYSVEDINKGVVPWITIKGEDKEATQFIKAGATLKEVMNIIKTFRPELDIFLQLKEDKKYGEVF